MKDYGLSNAEIAAALGMSRDRTRGLLSEARKRRPSPEKIAEWGRAFEALAQHRGPSLDSIHDAPESAWLGEMVSNATIRYSQADWSTFVPTPLVSDAEPETGRKPVRHILIPDTQCKPGVPLEHLSWAGEYIAEHEPDVVIAIGDWWDMESLSEYDRGKKAFEGRRYKADIEAGNLGMDMFMAGINKCAKRPRLVFTMGNHEERILRALELEPRLEGVLGYHDFNLAEHGWEVHDFLTPVEIDGVTYCHYFPQPMSGRPYSGIVETMIKNIGFSFTQGHIQGKRVGSRELGNGRTLRGLVAGSFYQHQEAYKGVQGNKHWRGILVKNEVADGNYDLTEVSLDFLRRRYG